MVRLLNWITNLFPVWVVICCLLAMVHPEWFTWFKGNWIIWALAVIMLGMGITLSFDDFRQVLTMPRAVAVGFAAQYTIMPFLGWSIARGLRLEAAFAVGLILVACCPGGTASNVVTYLARAHVALSVLMTMCSTFGAVVMTPLLTKWLAGTYVPVDGWKLFLDTVTVVLAPLMIGLTLHHLAPRMVKTILPVAPLVSVIAIVMICASIIGANARVIRQSAALLFVAVALLHVGGFALGWVFAWAFGYGEIIRRTISIEVGMQNSGLGAFLAGKNFPSMPNAPTPCAISAVFHSVIGSILAGIWRIFPPKPKPER
jgi:BASS family bile acid:Na+ symporter